MSSCWCVFFWFQISPKTTLFQWKWCADLAHAKRHRFAQRENKFFFCYNTVSSLNRKSQNLALSSLTHEPNPCNHHFGFATSSCFVNLDVSKLQGSSSDGDGYGYGSLSLSFWIFLAIAGLEFWGFSLCLLGLLLFGFVVVFV